jgi:hypothetical protein
MHRVDSATWPCALRLRPPSAELSTSLSKSSGSRRYAQIRTLTAIAALANSMLSKSNFEQLAVTLDTPFTIYLLKSY